MKPLKIPNDSRDVNWEHQLKVRILQCGWKDNQQRAFVYLLDYNDSRLKEYKKYHYFSIIANEGRHRIEKILKVEFCIKSLGWHIFLFFHYDVGGSDLRKETFISVNGSFHTNTTHSNKVLYLVYMSDPNDF